MSNSGLKNRWSESGNRLKLCNSFDYIARWADPENVNMAPDVLERVRDAAVIMHESVCQSGNMGTALKYANGVRRDLQLIVDFEKILHELPKDNPHRTDPRLRTAIRRAGQFLEQEGETFQYC